MIICYKDDKPMPEKEIAKISRTFKFDTRADFRRNLIANIESKGYSPLLPEKKGLESTKDEIRYRDGRFITRFVFCAD